MITQDTAEQIKGIVDWVSVGTVVATLVGWLPHMAAFFTVIWAIFRAMNEYNVWKNREKK